MPQPITTGNFGEVSIPEEKIMLVALGSNVATETHSSIQVVQSAVEMLSDSGAKTIVRSRLFTTPAFPTGIGPDFVNAAVAFSAIWTPQRALEILHDIETRLGRERRHRWGARTADLDLIAKGALVLPDLSTQSRWRALSPRAQQRATPDQLILPHPRLQDRAFVLVPMMDVAPDWAHPITGLTVQQMHDALPLVERAAIRPLEIDL